MRASRMAHRYRELAPQDRISFEECQELTQGVTMLIEGLNVDLPEELFLVRFPRFTGERCDWGHFGIVGIKFNYETRDARYILGGTRLVSSGNVLLTFAREWLALTCQADFDGYMGGDLQQWK